ncbi:TIGR02281 family clan AA aspartic protease [Sphingobium sufflavum]|uniref:retropepsin-like aspartic protease family protein n=1 Tax=Sphingobium sufflavum TaxID=1129547 RepID=UPI001F45E2F5|nr:TIGR02281 family clan AA aspartic protease [Sphingobium sufflavum]MCE7798312.1 TIGR02281 family clan AA aspartic protease [Sphingobium sufflavum]
MVGKHSIAAGVLIASALILSGTAQARLDAVPDAPSPVANAAMLSPETGAPAGVSVNPAHDIVRSADGLFYTHALVNGQQVRFLVDTGASVMVLTAADARAIGLTVEDKHYNRSVDTVGGAAPMAWATIERIHIAGHEVRNIRAAVVRNGLGVSLMGQNMLAKLDSVTITADRLSLR